MRGLRPPFFFQAEDGIRDLVRSRGLGDVYKRQFEIPVNKKTYNSLSPAHKAILKNAAYAANSLSLIHI